MEETPKDTAPPRVTRNGRRPLQNGAAIQALREKDGWSQTKLARAARIAQSTLSDIEGERASAPVTTLNRIARQLCVPVGAIMRDREAESESEPEGAAAA